MLRVLFKAVLWSVIAVLTMEICARLDDWVRYGAPLLGLYDNSVLDAFDQLGQHGKPNAQYLKWKLNSLGFRGPELDPHAMRILCIGSSETFGQYESEGHEWPRELERVLNANAPAGGRYQLVNAGFAGETFPTSVLRMPSRLALVKPKVVLLYPSLAHYLSMPAVRKTGPPPPPVKFRWRMQGRLETMLKNVLPIWLQTRLRQREIDNWQSKEPMFDSMPVEFQNEFYNDLETAIAQSRDAGAEPVLITHANRFKDRVEPSEHFMLVSWHKFYPMLREDAFMGMEETMNDVMRRVARERSVPLVDAARQMPSGPQYFQDFVHFTDKGSAAFSEIVARTLRPELMAQTLTVPAPSR